MDKDLTPHATRLLQEANAMRPEWAQLTPARMLSYLAEVEQWGYSRAYEFCFGCKPTQGWPADWRELARSLREQGKSYEEISIWLKVIHSPRHPSAVEVRRELDESGELKERQRKYDLDYYYRNRDARKAAMLDRWHRNKERYLAAKKAKRRNK